MEETACKENDQAAPELLVELFFERFRFAGNFTARRLELLLDARFINRKIDLAVFLFRFHIAPQQIDAKREDG